MEQNRLEEEELEMHHSIQDKRHNLQYHKHYNIHQVLEEHCIQDIRRYFAKEQIGLDHLHLVVREYFEQQPKEQRRHRKRHQERQEDVAAMEAQYHQHVAKEQHPINNELLADLIYNMLCYYLQVYLFRLQVHFLQAQPLNSCIRYPIEHLVHWPGWRIQGCCVVYNREKYVPYHHKYGRTMLK